MPVASLARSPEEAAEMGLVLYRLFQASNGLRDSIDAPTFRVENEYLIPTIDRLEQTPFIKREGDEYRLGMAALGDIQDPRATSFLQDCELILELLRKHYRDKETRKTPKLLVDIGKELKMPIGRVLQCVDVLKDIPWAWASGWNNPPTPIGERSVTVGESIIRYKTMESIFSQLGKAVDAQARDQRLLLATPRSDPLFGAEMVAHDLLAQVTKSGPKVFVVHGHDEGAREAACRVLEKLQLVPVVLFEQPDGGQTIVEKFERHASEVAFSVVILTPDDVGHSAGNQQDLRSRARQNVILELGYFAGKLGRKNMVVLHKGDVELPSDYHGVLYVPLDANGAWKWRLAAEIKNAGIEVDLNRIA